MTDPQNARLALGSGQNKQIMCSGLLGQEHRMRKIIPLGNSMFHPYLEYWVQFLRGKKGGGTGTRTVELEKLQRRWCG